MLFLKNMVFCKIMYLFPLASLEFSEARERRKSNSKTTALLFIFLLNSSPQTT